MGKNVYILRELIKYRKLYENYIKKYNKYLESCDKDVIEDYESRVALITKTDEEYQNIMKILNDNKYLEHHIRKKKATIYAKIKECQKDLDEIELKIMLI